jgi:dephospho-CoA kinase
VEPIRAQQVRIGLTGGIGSGKSTVAAAFVSLGATLVDADAIARSLTARGGAAIPELRRAFGDEIVASDGALDRSRMRMLAFRDPVLRQRLEAVLHPMIGVVATSQAAAASTHFIVFDVPLLAESSHWRARVDRVLVVDCEVATQIARVARRPGWTAEMAASVVQTQTTRVARRATADAVVYNDGDMSVDALGQAVATLEQFWRRSVPAHVEQ